MDGWMIVSIDRSMIMIAHSIYMMNERPPSVVGIYSTEATARKVLAMKYIRMTDRALRQLEHEFGARYAGGRGFYEQWERRVRAMFEIVPVHFDIPAAVQNKVEVDD